MRLISIPQLELLIKKFAGKKVKNNVVQDIARVFHEKQQLFKYGQTEIRLFIGQAAHETGGFTSFREKYNGDPKEYFESKYGWKTKIGRTLGNTQEGDGYLFYGRGMLHITGRENYEKYSGKIGKATEIMETPKLLEQNIEFAASISVAYWLDRVQPNLMSLYVSDEQRLFAISTEGINYNELHTEKIKIDETMSEAKKVEQRKKIQDLQDRLANRRKKVMAALHFEIPHALPEVRDKKTDLLYDTCMSFLREEVYVFLLNLLLGKPPKRKTYRGLP